MLFADRLTLDKPRRTADGFLVTRAKAARTGVYVYTGAEVDPENKNGLRDQAAVNVLRGGDTVFDKKSLHSFIGKPITNDHPSQPVTAENWRDHARGVIMGAVRDGEYVAFDLLLTDAAAIADVEGGKRQLSNGYAAELEFGDFEAADGTKCQVRQTSVRGNHCAIVDRARAGDNCAIADAATCGSLPADVFDFLTDGRTYSPAPNTNKNGSPNNGDGTMPHTLIIDGLQVTEVSDQAKAAIEKLQGQLKAAEADKAKAEADGNKLMLDVSTKDGEIAALTKKLEDAEIKPAQLEQMVADRSALIAQAKAVHPELVTDGKTEAEIRKAVVDAKLGDVAKDMDEAAIGGAFKVLAKDVKPIDPVRNALSGGVVSIGDAKAEYDKARDAAKKNLSEAWKGAPAKAA